MPEEKQHLGGGMPFTVKPARIDNIQYFRGFAALSVMIAHFANQLLQWHTFAQASLISGRFGVDVFFVISGVIMYYTGLRADGSGQHPAIFALKRLIRIVPLYWIATVIEMALRLIERNSFTVDSIVTSLFFIPSGHDPILGVGWTLNLEMYFYVVITVALITVPRHSANVVTAWFMITPLAHPFLHNAPVALQAWTDPSLFEFAFGISVGRFWERWGTFIKAWGLGAATLIFAAMLVADNIYVGRHLPLVLHLMGGAVIIALAMLTGNVAPKGLLRPLEYLGNASYSLYLTHVLTAGYLLQVAYVLHWSATVWLSVTVPTAIIVTYAAYKWVERPISRHLNRNFDKLPVSVYTTKFQSSPADCGKL